MFWNDNDEDRLNSRMIVVHRGELKSWFMLCKCIGSLFDQIVVDLRNDDVFCASCDFYCDW